MKMIVAVDKNWAIGKNGDLLIRIKQDLKRFKEMTTNNVIILGRKTLETFPNKKPLSNRINIILTKNKNYNNIDAIICNDIESAIIESKKFTDKEIFIVGGASIYNAMIDKCDTIFVTKINYEFQNADTFIENLDNKKNWKISKIEKTIYQDNIAFNYITYKKIK